jgi:hypothetical protein
MKNKLILPALALMIGTAGAVAATSPADAAPADSTDTTVTFSLTGGALKISAPAAADLGTKAITATSIAGPIGPVSVDDSRGLAVSNWSVNVSTTGFTTGSGASAHTIPATSVLYEPGVVTGTGVAIGVPQALNLPTPVVTATGVLGNNSGTWKPTLTVLLPGSGAVAGSYSGTVTHSVS